MDLNEYQKQALRTAAQLTRKTDLDFGIVALGVAGEAGEVADYVKKVIGHGHKMDKDKLIKELGDVMWYVAVLASMIDVPLSDVAVTNIAKLKARYPDGFDSQRSINRKENTEHVKHHCGDDSCYVCRSGLYQCDVCGQAEGELQKFCAGHKKEKRLGHSDVVGPMSGAPED